VTKKAKKRRTSDAIEIFHQTFVKGDPKRLEAIEKEKKRLEIAEQIYAIRTKAKLSQQQLAKKVGTTQSVISRLENAEYSGHTLSMLNKIAMALGHEVEVRLVPSSSYNYTY